ncbi:quinol monooxygenase YgiN [Kineococcus radiotolerans]|uniref:Quinol monooxygenase YgiN n=1 Tax=Kineococcus radiotolerans TaxID=131568 RepID=A0A7W4TRW6_KINRA|nr:putative quinol monooxygenase [Kineococcus radiotolerans]MBB2903597.1 quinol monooxygenase YgiN [Kineococcus radiotolerans]
MTTTVVAEIRPLAGQEREVEQALRAAVTRVLAEDRGCERYELNTDPTDGSYVMIERWADEAALAEHAAGPAFADLGTALEGRLAQPIVVRALHPLT